MSEKSRKSFSSQHKAKVALEAIRGVKTVNEIAYELGFKYPQHFSRMFKKETGYTPKEYRSLN